MIKMQYLILLVVTVLSLNCKGQNKEFTEYLSNFEKMEIPQSISSTNFYTVFPQSIFDSPGMIPVDYVKKFVYNNKKTTFLSSDYSYGYGRVWETKNYYITLLQRFHDQGDDVYNFDLRELVLVVYDNEGKFLDCKSISKDNEVWSSEIAVQTQTHIIVKQVLMHADGENIDMHKIYDADIQTTEFDITEDGYISVKHIDNSTGQLIWDEQIDNFKLK